MLMQGIRDQAKGWIAWVIVILISIPFALWGIQEYLGGGGKIVVAKVNSQEIDKYAFDFQVNSQIQRLRSFGAEFDFSSLEKQIKETTLERMINEEILFQTALDNQLRVGNALLEASIHKIPSFQANEQFSKALYEQLVQAQYPSLVEFENEMRRDLLLGQLQQGLSDSALLSPTEQADYEKLDKQQRLISYVLIKADSFKETVNITEEEIKAHYDAHQQAYFTPEKVSIEYVVLDKSKLAKHTDISEDLLKRRYEQQKAQYTTAAQWQASHILMANDVEHAKQEAEKVLQRVKAGEDFAMLAKEFSKDSSSAANGGDLGLFGPGRMVAPFEAAVKAMQVGEISDLVESRFGFHIIKLTDIKPEHVKAFEEVREELLKQVQQEEAQIQFEALVDEFSNLAFERPDTLQPIVDNLGLEKQNTALFTRTGEAEGMLANEKLLETAFSVAVLQDRNNSEVIELEDGRLLVMRVLQHEEAAAQLLETVKEKITETLRTEKSQTQAAELGQQILTAVQEQGDWQSLLKPQALTWAQALWITRDGAEPEQTQLRDAAFKMGKPSEQQALYQGIKLNTGDYAVLAILDVKLPESKQENDKASIAQQQRSFGQTEFQAFLSSLKEQADIKIYSSRL